MNTVLWLGGWASPYAGLKSLLSPLDPEALWIDCDSHEIAREPGQFTSVLSALPEKTVLLAWSLGALLLLRHLQVTPGRLPFPAILLCPIDSFCSPRGPWPERIVTRMRRKLAQSRQEVLEDFWGLMSPGSDSGKSAWLSEAMRLPLEYLDAGLGALQNLRVDLTRIPGQGAGLHLFGDAKDPLFPFDADLWKSRLPGATSQDLALGHWPFSQGGDFLRQRMAEIRQREEGS